MHDFVRQTAISCDFARQHSRSALTLARDTKKQELVTSKQSAGPDLRSRPVRPDHFEHGFRRHLEMVSATHRACDRSRERGVVDAIPDECFVDMDGDDFAERQPSFGVSPSRPRKRGLNDKPPSRLRSTRDGARRIALCHRELPPSPDWPNRRERRAGGHRNPDHSHVWRSGKSLLCFCCLRLGDDPCA